MRLKSHGTRHLGQQVAGQPPGWHGHPNRNGHSNDHILANQLVFLADFLADVRFLTTVTQFPWQTFS